MKNSKKKFEEETFCEACKNTINQKTGMNIVKQIEKDLWEEMIKGGTDF